MTTVYREEFQKRAQSTTMLSVALGLVTALQAVTMFFALRDQLAGGGAESIAIPIGAGVVIGVAFWVAWHWLCRVGPLAHSPVTRTMFVGVAGILTLLAISTTSWFVASAIGGGQALQKHMQAHLVKVDSQLAVVTVNAVAEQEVSDKLGMIAAGWRALAESEERGNVPGARARAAVRTARPTSGPSATYAAQHANVEAVFDEFKTDKAKAIELREAMNKIASSDASPVGQAKFSEMAAHYGQLVAKMNALTALPRVGAGIVEVEKQNGLTSIKNETLDHGAEGQGQEPQGARKPIPAAFYATMSKSTATIEYARRRDCRLASRCGVRSAAVHHVRDDDAGLQRGAHAVRGEATVHGDRPQRGVMRRLLSDEGAIGLTPTAPGWRRLSC